VRYNGFTMKSKAKAYDEWIEAYRQDKEARQDFVEAHDRWVMKQEEWEADRAEAEEELRLYNDENGLLSDGTIYDEDTDSWVPYNSKK
jgi:hypothetical protein